MTNTTTIEMTKSELEELFLPTNLKPPALPTIWHPEKSVLKINKLTTIAKPAVEDIIDEFWIAHEKIVRKEVPGWTWGRFCEETGYSTRTPIIWFEKYHLPITRIAGPKPKNLGLNKPLKKHTKPDVKIQLKEINKEIKKGGISDDDLKTVGDTIAESITSGQSAMRVGTKVATAIKKECKKGKKIEPKPIDNFDRIRKHIRNAIDGLTLWADGTIKPENEDEVGCAKAILASGANMIIQYARLGIDVRGVYQTFIEGDKKNEYTEEEKFHRAKQIN